MHGYLLQPTSNVQGFGLYIYGMHDVTMIDIRYIIGVHTTSKRNEHAVSPVLKDSWNLRVDALLSGCMIS